jgi:selenophosphate synthase
MDVLFDPQTSGGLLVALRPDRVDEYLRLMAEDGGDAWRVGSVEAGSGVEVVARSGTNQSNGDGRDAELCHEWW